MKRRIDVDAKDAEGDEEGEEDERGLIPRS